MVVEHLVGTGHRSKEAVIVHNLRRVRSGIGIEAKNLIRDCRTDDIWNAEDIAHNRTEGVVRHGRVKVNCAHSAY